MADNIFTKITMRDTKKYSLVFFIYDLTSRI